MTTNAAAHEARKIMLEISKENPELCSEFVSAKRVAGVKGITIDWKTLYKVLEHNYSSGPFDYKDIKKGRTTLDVLSNLKIIQALRKEHGLDAFYRNAKCLFVMRMRFKDPFAGRTGRVETKILRTPYFESLTTEAVLDVLVGPREPGEVALLVKRPEGDGFYGVTNEELRDAFGNAKTTPPLFTVGRRFRILGTEGDGEEPEVVATMFSVGYPSYRAVLVELDAFVRKKHNRRRRVDDLVHITHGFGPNDADGGSIKRLVDANGLLRWPKGAVMKYSTEEATREIQDRVTVFACDCLDNREEVVYEGMLQPEKWQLWLGIDTMLHDKHGVLKDLNRSKPLLYFYEESGNRENARIAVELRDDHGAFSDEKADFHSPRFRLRYGSCIYVRVESRFDNVRTRFGTQSELLDSLRSFAKPMRFSADPKEITFEFVRDRASRSLKEHVVSMNPDVDTIQSELFIDEVIVGENDWYCDNENLFLLAISPEDSSRVEVPLLNDRDVQEHLAEGRKVLVLRTVSQIISPWDEEELTLGEMGLGVDDENMFSTSTSVSSA